MRTSSSRATCCITRDGRYGDSMERVLYNTVLGAIPIQPDGHAFYYSDYTRHAKKTFHPDRWPCCSGTLPMIAADYAISSCFTDPQGFYVNLYVPAQVTWNQDGAACGLSIETDYPYAPSVIMTLRLPSALNFHAQFAHTRRGEGASSRSTAFAIRSRCHSAVSPRSGANGVGGQDELELPLMRRLESIDAVHPDTVALLAGPLVLMRILDADDAASLPSPGRACWRPSATPTADTNGEPARRAGHQTQALPRHRRGSLSRVPAGRAVLTAKAGAAF